MISQEMVTIISRLLHPKIFGEHLLMRVPYPAQQVVMLCPHSHKIVSCGRGVGKSTVMITDDAVRKAATLPWIMALKCGMDRPLPMRTVLIGSVKEQAFELQEGIRRSFERHEWLRSLLSDRSTKTNIMLKDGSRIFVRPATHAARGSHADTYMVNGRIVKGLIRIVVDEGWFLKLLDFYSSIVEPMLMMGGPGSGMSVFSTPFGQEGEVWDNWIAPTTGDCCQPYEVDKYGFRKYAFDNTLCQTCMKKYHYVRFNFASTQNPYANRRMLLDAKRRLYASGREGVFKQEYEGIAETTTNLFFTKRHHEVMWNDELPEYHLNENGEFMKLHTTTGGEVRKDLVDLQGLLRQGGECYLGIDSNQGIESKRADYAGIGMVEKVRNGTPMVPLRLMQRFRQAIPFFRGTRYDKRSVLPFLIDYASFLMEIFGIRKTFIDQGSSGPAIYIALRQRFGDDRVELIKTSLQEKNRCLFHLRTMVERGFAQAPPIDFLVKETRYLRVDQDSLDEDKVRISKSKGWGAEGAQVDGVFTWGYAMRGTEGLTANVYGAVSNQLNLKKHFGDLVPMPVDSRRVSDIYAGSRN